MTKRPGVSQMVVRQRVSGAELYTLLPGLTTFVSRQQKLLQEEPSRRRYHDRSVRMAHRSPATSGVSMADRGAKVLPCLSVFDRSSSHGDFSTRDAKKRCTGGGQGNAAAMGHLLR